MNTEAKPVVENNSEPEQQPSTPSIKMIVILTGIAMISGFLVVLTAQLTAPIIAENQRIAIEKAVSKVIPGSINHLQYNIVEDKLVIATKNSKEQIIYAGYDSNGKLIGVAANAAAQGYAGMIYLLYGYEPACQCIRGIKVLKLSETPGLGDKIITDSDFQANFDALDVSLNSNLSELNNPVVTVKHGTKKNAWEIDAISGATISAKAVGKAINQSAQDLLPKLSPLLAQITELEK